MRISPHFVALSLFLFPGDVFAVRLGPPVDPCISQCPGKGCPLQCQVFSTCISGICYSVIPKVTPQKTGYHLEVMVQVTNQDGARHGVGTHLGLSGFAKPLAPSRRLGGFGWGSGGSWTQGRYLPPLLPGKAKVLRLSRNDVLTKLGYRYELTIKMAQVYHQVSGKSDTPVLSKILIDVPLKGAPVIRLYPPNPPRLVPTQKP